VHDEAVAARLHERRVEQSAQEPVGVGLVEHRPEHGLRDPAHDRSRLERPPCERVLDVLQVEPRERLDDAGQRCVLERKLGMLRDPCGGEHQRQRKSASDSIEPRRIARVHAEAFEQRAGIGLVERTERKAAEAVDREPSRHGALAPGQREARLRRERRHQNLP